MPPCLFPGLPSGYELRLLPYINTSPARCAGASGASLLLVPRFVLSLLLVAVLAGTGGCGSSEPGPAYIAAEAAYRQAWRVAPSTGYRGPEWDIALALLTTVPPKRKQDQRRAQPLIEEIEAGRASAKSREDEAAAAAAALLSVKSASSGGSGWGEPPVELPAPSRRSAGRAPPRAAAPPQPSVPAPVASAPQRPRPVSASVTVYTRASCGYCVAAKKWMAAENVSFQERSLDNDARLASELDGQLGRAGKGGLSGVPVIDWGGELIVGFNRARLSSLAARDRR